nr:MAG TPA: hypothetical protein [Bacteriophage sp.]
MSCLLLRRSLLLSSWSGNSISHLNIICQSWII